MLAANISTTKDSIDDSKYKALVKEESTISKQSPVYPTELIQQHTDIARTSSNNSNYYLSSKEKEPVAVPYSSGLSNINTDSNSLQYQQYYIQTDGYPDNDDENATLSFPQ